MMYFKIKDLKHKILNIYFILLYLLLIGMIGITFLYANENESIRNHYLLLDNRVVQDVVNAKLSIGEIQKHKKNPLFTEDKSWEKRFDNLYGNVIYDQEENIYKCWYSPFIVDYSAKGMSLKERKEKEYNPPENREMAICYAVSKDGINWKKPNLGLIEYENSKANNIVWRGPHGAGIFKDKYEADPEHKYKAIFQGLKVSTSPDGLHWRSPIKCENVDVAGDTHNNAFWAPSLNKYVGITRTWGDLGRQVARIESKDFNNWTPQEVILQGRDKDHQPYAMPVFYYAGIYLGLLAIHEQSSDRVWTELAWSSDTENWGRVCPGSPLIPCSEKILDYDYGCVYPCADPIFLDHEIRLYYGASDYLHFGWRKGSLCLASLRPDGFAGYEQKSDKRPAIITTSKLKYSGQDINITADVRSKGYVRVKILNSEGSHIATAKKITKTMTNGSLELSKKVKSEEIQLQFELKNVKLYSFRFIH